MSLQGNSYLISIFSKGLGMPTKITLNSVKELYKGYKEEGGWTFTTSIADGSLHICQEEGRSLEPHLQTPSYF